MKPGSSLPCRALTPPLLKISPVTILLRMDTGKILEKHGLTRDNTTRYIDAIIRSNQTQTAEEINVSRDTVNRYKNAFASMTEQERALLLAALFQEKLLEGGEE